MAIPLNQIYCQLILKPSRPVILNVFNVEKGCNTGIVSIKIPPDKTVFKNGFTIQNGKFPDFALAYKHLAYRHIVVDFLQDKWIKFI